MDIDMLFRIGPKFDVPYELRRVVQDAFATGSRIVCSPPPMDTDLDVVVLVDSLAVVNDLISMGYLHHNESQVAYDIPDGSGEDAFVSLRKGDVNLIVVSNRTGFERWRLYTEAATRLNLLNKSDRVALAEVIRGFTLLKSI